MKKKRKAQLKDMLKKYGDGLNWLEEGELRSWVDAGNSPLDNPEGVMNENGILLDFIEWHRAARWVTEKAELHPWSCFDSLLYFLKDDYKPRSKKEAEDYLRKVKDCFGEELNDFIRFLNSENLIDRYEEFKLFTNSGLPEELPFS